MTTAYHPCASSMVERLHHHKKQALISSNTKRPAVHYCRNGLQNHTLPADFLVKASDIKPGTFGKQLCKWMTRVCSRPARPSRQQDIYMPPGLQDCSQVFIRKYPRPPLCPPCEGPFPVIRRSDKTITVTIDHIKPAHLQQPFRISRDRFAIATLDGECCNGI
ncbi:uncharacterized protein [Penaeus vannamei]|uniref:uncharacterized protein n=1 Tax=Penaeus vannamei TaxID=6689 RepID=UPI00387F8CA8